MKDESEKDAASAANRSAKITKPNFATLADVDQQDTDLLESAAAALSAGQPDEILKDKKVLRALLGTLQNLRSSHQAALFISALIIDGCQRDTSNWKLAAEGTDNISGTEAVYDCFMKLWPNADTNDNLGFLLSNLINYHIGERDLRPLFKLIIDPGQKVEMSLTGRLASIANLLRLDSLRFDLASSSTLRNVVSQGLQLGGGAGSLQDIYYAVLCLWQLSFNAKVMEEKGPLYTHRTILRSFLNMLSTNKKEKIVRGSVKALNNLIDVEWCFEILVQQKIDYLLTCLTYENWRDPELNDNINSLIHKFYAKQNQMNNFERYMKELDNGSFLPGPLHNEKFWIQNVNRFEDNEYEAVKKLAKLLFKENDPVTQSLAVFDIGEFARLYPTGKQIVTNIGAKSRVLELMNSASKEVAREALLTTQKLMLDNWKQMDH